MRNNIYIGKPLAYNFIIKPTGPLCNLNCEYCYYLEKRKIYPVQKYFKISENILELFIKQYIESQEVPVIIFVWQGGEPAMLGIDFYRKAISIQKKYAGDKKIENYFQTNGTLISNEWCAFFKENNMLIGVSIDGPEHIHNKYRRGIDGKGSFKKVMYGIELLIKNNVEFNTLSVVNDYNSDYPIEIYRFFKNIGSRFMQFIPVVERKSKNFVSNDLYLVHPDFKNEAEVTSWSVNGKKYGDFLISLFDEWIRNDVGKYYIQLFDATLANWVGENPGLCLYKETCGDALVMEHNGDIYSCDHFVYPEDLIGNVLEKPLVEIINSKKQQIFGEKKLISLPKKCIECEYRFACHGECPKNRISYTEDGEYGLNYLCSGLYSFFKHAHPYMQFMADELKNKRPPSNVMNWARNINT